MGEIKGCDEKRAKKEVEVDQGGGKQKDHLSTNARQIRREAKKKEDSLSGNNYFFQSSVRTT